MNEIPIRRIPNSKKEPALIGSFNIRDLRDMMDNTDMVQELHRHDFYYILALESAVGTHEIDFISYEVSDYSIFIMRPGQVHELTLKSGSTGYLLQFNADFYIPRSNRSHQLLRKASGTNHYQLDADKSEKNLPALAAIYQEYSAKQNRYQTAIQSYLEIILIELIRQQDNTSSHNVATYKQQRLEDFLELLESHISICKRVSEYADMMNLSAYQLNASTKATVGKTCSELINDLIILESKRQLLATTKQVKEIAYRLGYEDVSYYIRFFKKHTGHSPDAFRQNFK
ncbi:helix-turn-helix domain-containing protein [Fodinibius halophilus]|uniref:Helix-turn-helix domain-containing protein n=1 Tax=Fodinibius halophilus TaxID=1736908 RepID=A0A6M1T326_9BACT|nr:helix-turn-helix domain-containing protein [Fodinibius halophilus]NGP88459.1 helix-turn-helix domain-containing protein [Fodinibius halophilus]